MCGRYVSATPPDQLARYFDAALGETSLPANYNVAPTNDVYAIVDTPEGRRLEVFHWGLVPVWAKDIKVGNRMINARAETVATSTAFKSAFRKKRCLVPLDGFYEWQAQPGGAKKQPMYVHRLDGEPLAVAGLWERWPGPKDGEKLPLPLHSLTLITTTANETMAPIHDRMPVILPVSAWDAWLDPANDDVEALGQLLVPAPKTLLTVQPVGFEVNNVRNKGPELIDPVDPADLADPGTLPLGSDRNSAH